MNAPELEHAIVNGELFLNYQPIVDLTSREIMGSEALVRWRHPRRGVVPPLEFIGLAETSGLIDALTEWVLDSALAQWREWRATGFAPLLAINISAKNLARSDFPDNAAAACRKYGVPCERISLEVTESATQDSIDMMEKLTRLRLKGFNCAIDDFGTGFSSLVQLRDLPFSEMKIDRSFVMTADTSKADRVIVKAIIDLAHNLSLGVVAEGVESSEVLDLLFDLGCDRAQGYHIARPMPGETVAAWAADWQARPGVSAA